MSASHLKRLHAGVPGSLPGVPRVELLFRVSISQNFSWSRSLRLRINAAQL